MCVDKEEESEMRRKIPILFIFIAMKDYNFMGDLMSYLILAYTITEPYQNAVKSSAYRYISNLIFYDIEL